MLWHDLVWLAETYQKGLPGCLCTQIPSVNFICMIYYIGTSLWDGARRWNSYQFSTAASIFSLRTWSKFCFLLWPHMSSKRHTPKTYFPGTMRIFCCRKNTCLTTIPKVYINSLQTLITLMGNKRLCKTFTSCFFAFKNTGSL